MIDRIRTAICAAMLIAMVPAIADDESEQVPEKPEAAEKEATGKVCINSRFVRSFDGLSDQHVFIEERSKNYYLITMRRQCMGLRNANGIAIKDTTSQVCSNGFGDIVYRDMGRGIESCRIGTIEQVADKDDAKALIADRKAARDEARKKEKEEKKKN